jgi:hypothetical protein
MGYQRVDVRLANNRQINDVIVLNAEEIDYRTTTILAKSRRFAFTDRNPGD